MATVCPNNSHLSPYYAGLNKGGVALTGQTNATLNIGSIRPSDDGSYFVEVKNEFGTVRSESARLIVRGEAPVVVTTLAGNTNQGYVDSTIAANVRFYHPNSLAIQGDGTVLIPDEGNNAIRVLEPNGTVGTLAGRGPTEVGLSNGPASSALFFGPLAVAVTPAWDVFVADTGNDVVRKISSFGARTVSTFSGSGAEGLRNGAATNAQYRSPNDMVADGVGNLYVTEFGNHTVRKVAADGSVTTLAGTGEAGWRDGAAGQALFNGPAGIARDTIGNLYVTEWNNNTIRKIGTNGLVTTIAGRVGQAGFVDGPALTTAKLSAPDGIAVDGKGNIFFTEFANSSVRRLDGLGDVLTLVGTAGEGYRDGGRTNAMMWKPGGIAAHPDGSLLVADGWNNMIRRVVWQTNSAPNEAVVLIDLNPSITLFGVVGKTYRIEVSESMLAPNWISLGEVTLVSSVETWFDTQPVTRGQRYYRAVLKP